MKITKSMKKFIGVTLSFMMILAYTVGFDGLFAVNAEENTAEYTEREDAVNPDAGVEEAVLIASWKWVDHEEILTYNEKDKIWFVSPAADEENPITAELLEEYFPKAISAMLSDGTEKELEIIWDFSSLGEGVTEGDYTVQASLPEGYTLAEDAETLSATIKVDCGAVTLEEEPEGKVTAGGLTVTGKGISEGNGVTVGTDSTWGTYIQIETDTPVTISGTSTTHNIWIKENTTANITLAGVTITESEKKDSPVNLLPGSTCKMQMVEELLF